MGKTDAVQATILFYVVNLNSYLEEKRGFRIEKQHRKRLILLFSTTAAEIKIRLTSYFIFLKKCWEIHLFSKLKIVSFHRAKFNTAIVMAMTISLLIMVTREAEHAVSDTDMSDSFYKI